MKTALSIALIALLAAATAGILVVVHDLHRDLTDLHTVIDETAVTVRTAGGSIQTTGKAVGDAVTDIADAAENSQHDIRDLANGLTGSMDRVATDTARNLEIFGGTQNEIRQIIRDPRFKKQVFDALENSNELLQHAQLTLTTADGTLGKSQDTFDAATGTLHQASALFANADPFVMNLGKISGDAYTTEHRYFFPTKQKMSVAGYLWKGFEIGKEVVLPGSEIGYYLTNMK
jgi:hypothetical protein